MFVSKIDALRKEKRITTSSLAEKSGISRQAIYKARQDDGIAECRLSTLDRIASALGCSTKDLYEETKEVAAFSLPVFAEAAEETVRPYAAPKAKQKNPSVARPE